MSEEDQAKARHREKLAKVRAIIDKEFDEDIKRKEHHLQLIENTILKAKKAFHRLRYGIVNSYYHTKQLNLTNEEIQAQVSEQQHPTDKAKVYSILTDKNKRLHPAVERYANNSAEFDIQSPFTIRPPRKRSKPDDESDVKLSIGGESSASNSSNKSTENGEVQKPVKVPRYVKPKGLDKNVLKINPVSRNQQKEKFQLIIGNTSKYIGSQSESDKSTHRWLLYVRGPREKPDVSHFITSVTVQLHDSYAPHNIVHITSPPFHLTRRGWGEFPVKLRIYFKNKALNKPVNLVHELKLDRLYTGVQTLGSETEVNVWLYPDETMIEKLSPSKLKQIEEKKCKTPSPKKPTTIIEEVKIKLEPEEPKIEEYVVPKENGFIRPISNDYNANAFHNDHCYLKNTVVKGLCVKNLDDSNFLSAIYREVAKSKDVKTAVGFLLKKLPIVDDKYKNESFLSIVPFGVSSTEKYFKYNIYKQRAIEWCRAKMINDILKSSFFSIPNNRLFNRWSTKQIIIFSHYHGYYPVKIEELSPTSGKRYRNDPRNSDIAFENSEQINTKTVFDIKHPMKIKTEPLAKIKQEEDEEVDVCDDDDISINRVLVKKEPNSPIKQLETIPFEDEDEKLQCYFIEKKCAELGIHLRNEDVGHGYASSVPHKIILSALKSLVEDILRKSLEIKLKNEVRSSASQNSMMDVTKSCIWEKVESGKPQQIYLKHVFEALKSKPEFDLFTNHDLGSEAIEYKGSL